MLKAHDMTELFHYVGRHWPDLATLVGVIIAVVQMFRTHSAAVKTRRAVNETMQEVRGSFVRYAAGMAKRQLHDARVAVDSGQFHIAELRAADLAEVASQLALAVPAEAGSWQKTARDLRKWEGTWRRLARSSEAPTSDQLSKWGKDSAKIASALDPHDSPLVPATERTDA